MIERSEIKYARAGEHHIAYREYAGDPAGDVEIVMVNGYFFPMESLPDDPIANRLLEGLAGLGRLIVFDRRGIGLSDPVTDWETPTCEQWADDLAAVIAAAGCERPTVFSWIVGAVARTCSVRYPGLIGRLVLWNPTAPVTDDDAGWVAEYAAAQRRQLAGTGPAARGGAIAPGRTDDPIFQDWLAAAGRAGASPSLAARLNKMGLADPPFDNSSVSTPTLVITRLAPGWFVPEEFFERAVRQIPEAQHSALPSGDGFPFGVGVDDVLAEISRYVTGDVRLPPPERQITVIVFTDLVGSTSRAAATGDAEWKRLLDHHDGVNRNAVVRRGGEVIKTTGDGVFALLPSATAAIEAAQAIRKELGEHDLAVRIGIHLGEVDRRGTDVSGLAVNVAARIMGEASAGQILVSDLVTAVAVSPAFEAVGVRTLKGVEGEWNLFAVV